MMLKGLELLFNLAFVRGLVGRLDMDANQIMIRQSGDGGSAFGRIIRVEITGRAGHIDAFSSIRFLGFVGDAAPVAAPRTWLLRIGWRGPAG